MAVTPADLPAAAAITDDDIIVGNDGAVTKKFTASAFRGYVLPNGVVSADSFSALTGAQIDSCDATTGWTLVQPSTGGTVTSDAVTKTEGTASVSGLMGFKQTQSSKFLRTFTTPVDITSHTLVAFDVMQTLDGPGVDISELDIKVADGTDLVNGNVNTIPFPNVASGAWTTVVLPLSGLTAIKSIGLHRTRNIDGRDTITNWRRRIHIDNVRFLNESALDQAIGSADDVCVFVGASYTPPADQTPRYLPEGKAIVAPHAGVFTGLNKVVHLHDFLWDVDGAETGETDVSTQVNTIINSALPGQIIRATAGATYRFDQDLRIVANDVTVDFTGATCFLTYKSNTPFVTVVLSRNMRFVGGSWFGYYPTGPYNGSGLTTVAGTPTTSGTTKLLDALDESVKLPVHTNWNAGSYFARHVPRQLGLADDGEGARCYWQFTMHDSAQVAGDCQVIVSNELTGVVYKTETLTLTGTPTLYTVPLNIDAILHERLRVTVKKATATTNTITIATYVPYGDCTYNATYDIASAFLVASSYGITIEDMLIEGFGGDAVQVSDANVRFLTVRNVVSRGMRRQGMSFNQGEDMLIEGCTLSECGRSALDFEPFAATWFTRNVVVRNVVMYNVVNYGFAMANWSRNINYTIDGADLYGCRLGMIFGGFRNGRLANLRSYSASTQGSTDFHLIGQNMVVENLLVQRQLIGAMTTNTFNDGSGGVVYTPSSNVIRGLTTAAGGAGVKVSLGSAYRLENTSISLPTEVGALASTSTALGPISTPGEFANLHLGEFNRQLPNTYKGIAHSSVWIPGGFNHLDDPVYQARSLSGGAVRGNNLRGVAASVTASATSHAVAFPTRAVGTLSGTPTATGRSDAGSLVASTTYYYRVAPRGWVAGPGAYLAEFSRALSASQTSMTLEIKGFLDHTNDLLVAGFTLLRGTTTSGPYTQRYDVVPSRALATLPPASVFAVDLGTTLTFGYEGYAASYAVATGTYTAQNESGFEPDTDYAVMVETNWATTTHVSAKTTGGFTINFGTAAPGDGSGRVSWFLVR